MMLVRCQVNTRYRGRDHFHCMTIDAGLVVDGGTYGSEARFINHSCDPNCHIEKWNVLGVWRIGIMASRTIHPGEELGLVKECGVVASSVSRWVAPIPGRHGAAVL